MFLPSPKKKSKKIKIQKEYEYQANEQLLVFGNNLKKISTRKEKTSVAPGSEVVVFLFLPARGLLVPDNFLVRCVAQNVEIPISKN